MNTQAPPSIRERLFLLIPASVLAYFFLIRPAMQSWTDYWVLKDGLEGRAEITAFGAKNAVDYRYRVNGKEYTGKDRRTWEDRAKTEREGPIVYYSASRPWLSRLHRPVTLIPAGLPVLLLAWFFLALMLITIVNPGNKWALQLGKKENASSG